MRPAHAATVLIAMLPVSAFATGPREISGSLTYSERVALPSEAEMLLELRNDAGRVMASTAEATAGAQVPLRFTIDAPSDLTFPPISGPLRPGIFHL